MKIKLSDPPFCQIRIQWRKLQQLDQQLKNNFDISLDEAILLCCISHSCKNQGDIAGQTGLTPTQASRVLSRLETKGFIDRSVGEDDKRKMLFTINTAGEKKLQEISPTGFEYLAL